MSRIDKLIAALPADLRVRVGREADAMLARWPYEYCGFCDAHHAGDCGNTPEKLTDIAEKRRRTP